MIHPQDLGIPIWGIEHLERQGFTIKGRKVECKCSCIATRDGSISVLSSMDLKANSRFDTVEKVWIVSLETEK